MVEKNGRNTLRTGWLRRLRFLGSVVDPRSYIHLFRIIHYFHYTHVSQARRLTRGEGVRFAPNVSWANAERITIGDRTRIGARCHIWAGDSHGRVRIGSDTNLAPMCFLTASNYGFNPGSLIMDQPKHDADIDIGDDVWLGAGVMVLAGVSIGSGSIIAAGSVVTKDIPPGMIAGGIPARVLRAR